MGGIHAVFFGHLLLHAAIALDNGLGSTPAMGYNSWYDYGCSGDLNEANIMATADALVKSGLSKLGYVYVNVRASNWIAHRFI